MPERTRPCPYHLRDNSYSELTPPDFLHRFAATISDGMLEIDGLGGTEQPSNETLHRLMADTKILRSELDKCQKLIVMRAREAGLGWAEIGQQLGISKQAAQQKYGRN